MWREKLMRVRKKGNGALGRSAEGSSEGFAKYLQPRAGQGRASSRDGSVELRSRGAWDYLGLGSSACHEPGVEVRELGELRELRDT